MLGCRLNIRDSKKILIKSIQKICIIPRKIINGNLNKLKTCNPVLYKVLTLNKKNKLLYPVRDHQCTRQVIV